MLQQRVSKRSLDFPNQRKAYLLRKVDKLPWRTIASKVENVAGDRPVWGAVRNIVEQFDALAGLETQVAAAGPTYGHFSGRVNKLNSHYSVRCHKHYSIVFATTLFDINAVHRGAPCLPRGSLAEGCRKYQPMCPMGPWTLWAHGPYGPMGPMGPWAHGVTFKHTLSTPAMRGCGRSCRLRA